MRTYWLIAVMILMLIFWTGAALAEQVAPEAEQDSVSALIDVLAEKGILSAEEADKLKARVEEPEEPTPPSEEPTPPSEEPTPPSEKPTPPSEEPASSARETEVSDRQDQVPARTPLLSRRGGREPALLRQPR